MGKRADSNIYASTISNNKRIRLHVGCESITDEDHENSSYMRIRVSRILAKHFPQCVVCCLSCDTKETLKNCEIKMPDIAFLSIRLPQEDSFSLESLITTLQGLGIKVIILFKVSETQPEDEMILKMPDVTSIRVKKIQEDFKEYLSTLT